MKMTKERVVERINQLILQGDAVKTTYKPNPPNVIGFPTLSRGDFDGWKTTAENLILAVAGASSPYYVNFVKRAEDPYRNHVDSGVGILKGLKDDVELGLIDKVENLVLAEVFSDFIDITNNLLAVGYKDPAASLIGAVLEDGLRRLAVRNGVGFSESDAMGSLNSKLADAQVYNNLVRKQIQAWKGIRDSADHGKFEDYTKEMVQEMVAGVGRFLSEQL